MTEWTPKQHIEHQQLLERLERERKESPAPEPVVRKTRKKKARKKPSNL